MTIRRCFVDTETTGLNHEKNGIIQIAAVIGQVVGGEWVRESEYVSRIAPWPQDVVEPEALKVSGVTVEQIVAYPTPVDVHYHLTQWLGLHCDKFEKRDKMIFAGYNAPFDNQFMREWFKKAADQYFGSWFWNPPMDVMSLAIEHMVDIRWTMPDFKLATVARTLGIEVVQEHDAMHDINLTIEIWKKVKGIK